MKRTWALAILMSGVVACGGESGDVEYDPAWGNEQLVPDEKSDFLDHAPELEFGGEATGSLTSTELDVYKIELTRGDEFRITKRTTDGDLSPDVTLHLRAGTTVHSDDFDVTSDTLVKNYTATSSSMHMLAVRAFRNQGAGDYELTIECTGGPCAGEFPEPDEVDEELDLDDRAECIQDARLCAMEYLERYNGRVGPARSEKAFTECLETSGIRGLSCANACEDDEDAKALCDDMIGQFPFYADQTESCHETLNTCMDECTEMSEGGWHGFMSMPVNMCWRDGFNSTCGEFAKKMPECGGDITIDVARCHAECQTLEGVWMDDLDTVCEDQCGECGMACSEQLGWYDFPDTGLVGKVDDRFMGEMDPFVVGDTCVTYVEVLEDVQGDIPPGIYGLIEDLSQDCTADRAEFHMGDPIAVPNSAMVEVTDDETLDVLNDFRQATYFEVTDPDAVRLWF